MRRPVTQRLMRSLVVVKLEIVGKMYPRRRDRLILPLKPHSTRKRRNPSHLGESIGGNRDPASMLYHLYYTHLLQQLQLRLRQTIENQS